MIKWLYKPYFEIMVSPYPIFHPSPEATRLNDSSWFFVISKAPNNMPVFSLNSFSILGSVVWISIMEDQPFTSLASSHTSFFPSSRYC